MVWKRNILPLRNFKWQLKITQIITITKEFKKKQNGCPLFYTGKHPYVQLNLKMCPGFWVHINTVSSFFIRYCKTFNGKNNTAKSEFYIIFQNGLLFKEHCLPPNPSHCEGFCTTRSESFTLFVSSDSFLTAFSHILCS